MGLVNTLHTQVLHPYVHKPMHYTAVGTVGAVFVCMGGGGIPPNFGRYVSLFASGGQIRPPDFRTFYGSVVYITMDWVEICS